jgi:pimeloyl-ACP methyl ester carboxylesterase
MAGKLEKLVVAGVRTEVLRQGNGPQLLFLHPGDGIDWDAPVLTGLAKHFEVIAPSHPGFGDSELPPSFSTIDDLAYFYLDLMDELDLRDVVLVGASFGGWIAMEIAVKSAGRLSRLVLADTVGVKFGPRETRDIVDLFSLTPRELGPLLYSQPERFAPDYKTLPPQVLALAARNREAFTLFGWSPTLYDPKLRQRLHRLMLPTLLLWGAEDRVVGADYGKALASALPDARLELIAGAGHYPHVEQPMEFVARVAAFSENAPARKGVAR